MGKINMTVWIIEELHQYLLDTKETTGVSISFQLEKLITEAMNEKTNQKDAS